MSKPKVIENTDLQIVDSNTEKREGTSYTTLVYNGEFVNSRGNYQLFFVNDHLYSITRMLLTGDDNISENYYKKWKIDLKANTVKGVKQTLLKNSRYEGDLYLIDLNKADLSKFNISKNNIPEVFKYMIIQIMLFA